MLPLGEAGRNSGMEKLTGAGTTPDVLTPGTEQALHKHALNELIKNHLNRDG